jgi:universal stress protein E
MVIRQAAGRESQPFIRPASMPGRGILAQTPSRILVRSTGRVHLQAMEGYSSIIAAVDFSSSSLQVLAHAAKLASANGARLTAAHVIAESGIRDWEKASGREAPVSGRIKEISQHLDELVAKSCNHSAVEKVVRIGDPQHVLSEIIKDQSADLLVLGAHDVSKRRLGSVASRCARLAPSDVLLLRDWQSRFFRKIVIGVDFSPQSVVALDRAISLASTHAAALEIIHVIFPPTRDPWGRVMDQPMDSDLSYEAAVRQQAAARLSKLVTPFSHRLAGIRSETMIFEGECPAAAISAHVDAAGIDLTVMGSRDGSWVTDFVLGSNTERLLQDSSSSVLIVRD